MSERLLIVDDDEQIASLLAELLAKNNYIADCASNTEKADALLAKNHYDLLILDVLMPGEKGTDYMLRKKQELADTPIIMLSALGDVDDELAGLVSGADDYLTKPFDPSVLLIKVAKLIKKNKTLKQNKKLKTFGDFQFDLVANILWQNGNKIRLTTSHQQLLQLFCSNVGNALSRDKIRAHMQKNYINWYLKKRIN